MHHPIRTALLPTVPRLTVHRTIVMEQEGMEQEGTGGMARTGDMALEVMEDTAVMERATHTGCHQESIQRQANPP